MHTDRHARMTRLAALLLAALLSGCAADATRPDADGDLFQQQRRAAALYQKKQYRQALDLYLDLSQRAPRDALVWFRLGNVYARLNRPDDAVAAYRHALTLNPAMPRAWHNMGVIQLRQAANTYTEMATHLEPADPLHAEAVEKAAVLLKLLETKTDAPGAGTP